LFYKIEMNEVDASTRKSMNFEILEQIALHVHGDLEGKVADTEEKWKSIMKFLLRNVFCSPTEREESSNI
jgi:hypothetical protein